MVNYIAWINEILSAANMNVDSNGDFAVIVGDKSVPIMVNGKQLRIPANPDFDKDKFASINPIIEAAGDAVPPELAKLIHVISQSLGAKVQLLISALIGFGVKKDQSGGVNDLSSLKVIVSDVTTVVSADIRKIFAAAVSASGLSPVKLTLKKNLRIGARTYSWGTILSFPLYDAVCGSDSKKIGDLSVSEKTKQVLKGLYEWIFDGLEKDKQFTYPATLDTAPRLSSALGALKGGLGMLADTADVLEGAVDCEQMVAAADWSLSGDYLTSSGIYQEAREAGHYAPRSSIAKPAPPPAAQRQSQQQERVQQIQQTTAPQHQLPVQQIQTQQPAAVPNNGQIPLSDYMNNMQRSAPSSVQGGEIRRVWDSATGQFIDVLMRGGQQGQADPYAGVPASMRSPAPPPVQQMHQPATAALIPHGATQIVRLQDGRQAYADQVGNILGLANPQPTQAIQPPLHQVQGYQSQAQYSTAPTCQSYYNPPTEQIGAARKGGF